MNSNWRATWFGTLVLSLNALHLNVWAVFILVGGIFLSCCGHVAEGGALVAGSFALLRDRKDANAAKA